MKFFGKHSRFLFAACPPVFLLLGAMRLTGAATPVPQQRMPVCVPAGGSAALRARLIHQLTGVFNMGLPARKARDNTGKAQLQAQKQARSQKKERAQTPQEKARRKGSGRIFAWWRCRVLPRVSRGAQSE